MKLHEHERARPNLAGLASPVQRAEMKLLLAGRWPPLKPLPVFKYETHEYRASIDFDKTRGEWVCRKTSLPSNKVQELRGGLTEITMGYPMVKQKCSPKMSRQNHKNKNWRGTPIVASRPFLSGERITRTAHSILNCRTIFPKASKMKSTTASGCLLLLGSFSSTPRMLRSSLTHSRRRAAGSQHS